MIAGSPAQSKILSAAQVAAVLDHSAAWFRRNLPRLQRAGFPKRDILLGGWHEAAVLRWKAERIEGTVPDGDDELIRRAQQWAA